VFAPVTTDPTALFFTVDVPGAVAGDFYECQAFQSSGGSLNASAGPAGEFFSAKSY
jgi:hypothetical protein